MIVRQFKLSLTEKSVIGRKQKIPGLAQIYDKGRNYLGWAFVSPDSKHYLRFITNSAQPLDKAFWQARLKEAYQKRKKIAEITNAFRVVYAESDGLPSIIIDKFKDIWVMQISSSGAQTIKNILAEIILQEFKPQSLLEIPSSFEKDILDSSFKPNIVFGSKTCTQIQEADQKFELDVLAGQKTGAYLDYRSFRLKAKELAHGNCLDLFCYQGWLACQIAGNSQKVIAVDSSNLAVQAGIKNAKLNNHQNLEFIKADAFNFLNQCQLKFDFIHIDPPAFAKTQKQVKTAQLGYQKLISGALKCANPGAIIFISSCSHKITERILEETVLGTIQDKGTKAEKIFQGIQDIDHPVLKNYPETLYLKAIAVRLT
ncbi:MAG: class I SAM-dependent methyltransferase [Pseudomonadota bacterium]